MQQFPEQRRAVVGVAGEQLVQQGRARAPQPCHHDGRGNRLARTSASWLPEIHHAQTVLKDQLELAAEAEATGQVEPGLGVERRRTAGRRAPPTRCRRSRRARWWPSRRPGGVPAASETSERPSSPRPRPRATILSVQGLRGGGVHRRGVTVPATGDNRRMTTGRAPRARPRRRVENGPHGRPPADLSVDEIVDLLAAGAGRTAQPRPARSASSTTHSRRRRCWRASPRRPRAGGGRPGPRHRPPPARRHRRDPRRGRGGGGPALAGAAGGGDRLAARGGEAVSRGDRGRLRPGADHRQRGLLGRQGGPLSEEEAGFRARPGAADAVPLRRADDSGKVEGSRSPGSENWAPLLRRLSGDAGARVGALTSDGSERRLRHRRRHDRVGPVDPDHRPLRPPLRRSARGVLPQLCRAGRGRRGGVRPGRRDGGHRPGRRVDRRASAPRRGATRWSTSTPWARRSSRCSRCSWSTPGSSRSTTPSPRCGRSSPPRARRRRRCGTHCVTGRACRPSAPR